MDRTDFKRAVLRVHKGLRPTIPALKLAEVYESVAHACGCPNWDTLSAQLDALVLEDALSAIAAAEMALQSKYGSPARALNVIEVGDPDEFDRLAYPAQHPANRDFLRQQFEQPSLAVTPEIERWTKEARIAAEKFIRRTRWADDDNHVNSPLNFDSEERRPVHSVSPPMPAGGSAGVKIEYRKRRRPKKPAP